MVNRTQGERVFEPDEGIVALPHPGRNVVSGFPRRVVHDADRPVPEPRRKPRPGSVVAERQYGGNSEGLVKEVLMAARTRFRHREDPLGTAPPVCGDHGTTV